MGKNLEEFKLFEEECFLGNWVTSFETHKENQKSKKEKAFTVNIWYVLCEFWESFEGNNLIITYFCIDKF